MGSNGDPDSIYKDRGATRTAIYVVRLWSEPAAVGGALRGNVRMLGGPVLRSFNNADELCRIFDRILAAHTDAPRR